MYIHLHRAMLKRRNSLFHIIRGLLSVYPISQHYPRKLYQWNLRCTPIGGGGRKKNGNGKKANSNTFAHLAFRMVYWNFQPQTSKASRNVNSNVRKKYVVLGTKIFTQVRRLCRRERKKKTATPKPCRAMLYNAILS